MSDLAPSPALTRPAMPTLPVGGQRDDIRRAAQEFEATFLSQMLQPMFAGLQTDGPFGGGNAEATWRGFLIDSMARQIAGGGGIGLADQVQRELLSLQTVPVEPTSTEESA
ncbi:MAG: rod-binding protein [Caulobacterales bacterium]|nr:rod-binding protein [Caulobacterales bacterium]